MITVESLTKKYGGFTAVDDITFTARAGRVTGFLGPNGAGKSTTMRVMVGLTPATSGTATVSGRRFADLPNPGLEVGVLLDASAQHAGRTGREILTIAQRTMGLPGRPGRRDARPGQPDRRPRPSRRVRNYSLGMRQRLGIATALIGDPEVLILDEPANGLDPAGIRWMRDLLRGYANRGGTVLLSSHLLHEIEVIADDIVVIGNGRIVAQGTKAELLAGRRHRRPRCRPRATSSAPSVGVAESPRPGPATARCAPTPTPSWSARSRSQAGVAAHRAASRRRRRPRGDVPRAHRRHPTRRSSGMTAVAVEHRPRTASHRPYPDADPAVPGDRRSSCARCSTPARASG